jgi:ribonucleotide monophosphatase NagD (HAD superfamily)
MGLPAERCMMIGDRLETDIRMGQNANFATAATLTGVAKREEIALMSRPPDYIIENLSELPGLID